VNNIKASAPIETVSKKGLYLVRMAVL